MSDTRSRVATSRNAYPLGVSVTMIVAAILLSFVDLTFLNDVIGKILEMGSVESMVTAFALGMVGLAIMAHQGVKAAHRNESPRDIATHYLLWVSLGIALAMIRLFSASIMQLDGSDGDASLMNVLGITIREVDILLAPLMIFLYLASGILVKDGVKNLLINDGFNTWWESRKESARLRKEKAAQRADKIEKEREKLRKEAEDLKKKREKELDDDRLAQKKREEEERRKKEKREEDDRIKSALNGTYSNALAQYRSKEEDIKEKYQIIYSNIEFIKDIDKQEAEFEDRVKPSLMKIVDASVLSTQNSVALKIRQKTGEDIAGLRNAIGLHNLDKHDKPHKDI